MTHPINDLGYCPTCRELLVAQNGVPTCFNCSARKPSSKKTPVAVDIPNEKEFNEVMKQESGKTYDPAKAPVGKAGMVVTGNTAHDALRIMRSLPMPKNMQEFKQIQKIIKQLEKLVGEENV